MTAINAKLKSSGTIATLMIRPQAWSLRLSETEIISFWMRRTIKTIIARRAIEAAMAMLVTVVTVVVVTVEIIETS